MPDLEINILADEDDGIKAIERVDKRIDKSADRQAKASQQVRRAKSLESQAAKRSSDIRTRALREIDRAEKRSATFGLRGVERLKAQRSELTRLARQAGLTQREIDRATGSFKRMERQLERNQRQTSRRGAVGFGTTVKGGLAALGIGVAVNELVGFAQNAVRAAARAEQLSISLDVLARRTNVSRLAMERTEERLRSMRLTQVQARDAIQLFTRAGAKQQEIIQLVGVAYDAAARRGLTLDDALRRLADATAKAEPELLDELGIVIKLGEVYSKYAKQLGITNANTLTAVQRSRALVEALAENAKRGGEFSATTNTLSRSLQLAGQSSKLLSERLGGVFSPIAKSAVDVYRGGVEGLTAALGALRREFGPLALLARSFREQGPAGLSDAGIIRQLANEEVSRRNRAAVGELETRLLGRSSAPGTGTAGGGGAAPRFRPTRRTITPTSPLSGIDITSGADAIRVEARARAEENAELRRQAANAKRLSEEQTRNRIDAQNRLNQRESDQRRDKFAAQRDAFEKQKRLAERQAEFLQRQNERVFDNFKRSAGDLFDSLISRSRSFFDVLGNIMKTALLAPIKEIVSSRVAGLMMQLFGGATLRARASGGGGGGFGFGNIFGSAVGSAVSFPGAPGGTVGFNGPVAGFGTRQASAASGGTGQLGFGALGLAGGVGGLRDLFGLGSSITTGAGATTFQAATLGQKFGSFASSTGGALVGAGLLAYGLKRGGLSGIGLSAAGGALIGAKFGGPIGAAIGAAAGATAGFIRTLFKTATEKVREKIKSVYGLEVRDKGILNQILDTARAQFGGNIDVAIRSPGVRDLLELFAAATGQSFSGFNNRIRPVNLVQFGDGTLAQRAQFRHGRPIALQSPLPTVGPGGRLLNVIKLDGPATTQLLQGEATKAIESNPRTVQNASLEASSQNFGRRESAALGLEPRALLT